MHQIKGTVCSRNLHRTRQLHVRFCSSATAVRPSARNKSALTAVCAKARKPAWPIFVDGKYISNLLFESPLELITSITTKQIICDIMDSPSDVIVSFAEDALRLDTSEDAEIICAKLADQDVNILILQGNTFGIEAAERIGLELARQPNLREAHFKDVFTSRGREEVPEALKHLLKGISDSGAQLTLLDLSDNAIGPIGAPSLIEFLNSSSADTIEMLFLSNCGLGPEGSTSIAPSISRLKNLREFFVGRNRLENKGATNMSRALKEIKGLEVLKADQNGIFVPGIKELVGVLLANKDTIRVIDFSDNTIKNQGADDLALAISQAKNLRVLHLNDALLGNQGFSIICDALSKSPSLAALEEASFEGNELQGPKLVDLIELTFAPCRQSFLLNLLENDFTPDELTRLGGLSRRFNIYVDEIDSYDDDDDDDDDDDTDGDGDSKTRQNGANYREKEEGELDNSSEGSNGYVNLGNSESDLREVSLEFIEAVKRQPYNAEQANSAFIQLISIGAPNSSKANMNYQPVQILCEELGLMKSEETRKKKPLAREAIVYIGKRIDELPLAFRDFFQVVVKNNDELSCGKMLFDKF